MSRLPPNFDDLVDSDVPVEERARLERVHRLLAQADPPPELGPELDAVPWPEDALAPLGLTRRAGNRRFSPLVIAAAVATIFLVAFLLGQATGTSSSSFDVQRLVKMHGTALAKGATASIELGTSRTDGNWPMIVNVTSLRPLPRGGYYELFLSRAGKPLALCGSFNTKNTTTSVRLSAAYDLRAGRFDGWVVTRHLPGQTGSAPVVMTT